MSMRTPSAGRRRPHEIFRRAGGAMDTDASDLWVDGICDVRPVGTWLRK